MTDIALVVLDTLRKDAFDEHFDWLPGRRFERAYSTANWTVPAHASLFTGQYASEVGVHAKNMYLDCPRSVLAEQLRDAGYTTRAFSANTNVTGHFDFGRGFEDFRTPDEFDRLTDENLFDWRRFGRETNATGVQKYLRGVYECVTSDCATVPSLSVGFHLARSDEEVVEYGGAVEALAEIEDMDFGQQEFLFLNLMEAHEPYRVPPDYQTVPEPAMTNSIHDISIGDDVDAEQTKQAYDDCARYLSDVYQEVIETLKENFDYVVTVSDHGELLGEHDGWGHEYGVYPELTHVPLVIDGEGFSGECTKAVNLLDVHRTILDLADVEGESRGQVLTGDVEGREQLTEYHGLTSWSEKKLLDNGYEAEAETYDEERRGYAAKQDFYGYETPQGFEDAGTNSVENPREQLELLVRNLNIRQVEQDNEVPDEIKDRLEDLGYA